MHSEPRWEGDCALHLISMLSYFGNARATSDDSHDAFVQIVDGARGSPAISSKIFLAQRVPDSSAIEASRQRYAAFAGDICKCPRA
jgi:hypothetical protein